MKRYVVALDQGTTSSRAVVFDEHTEMVAVSQMEFQQIYPQPGWVEHDAMEIIATQVKVLQDAVSKAKIDVDDIAAIGITNQRETTVIWDRETAQPIYNAIVWQCRRTAGICDKLITDGHDEMIRDRTGLVVDAYFSGSKVKWLLDHVEGARERARAGELCFGTIDTWLIYHLTGGKSHATDYTNASRTMLYNIHDLKWDDEILDILDIPREMLPEVKPSSAFFGELDERILGRKIPILGVAGDQQAALFGQACFDKGMVKNTYGTGCFVLMNTGETACKSENRLLTTIAWGLNDKVTYALEGSIFMGGATIQWLRDEMRFIDNAPQSEVVAAQVEDAGGVYLVPAFTGLGAPYWDMYARGTIVGMTRGTGRAHIVRAALESIAYQSRDVIEAMEKDSGIELAALNVDGGASANNLLMQFQSDILGVTVNRPKCIESTALGAAYLAGLQAGVWKDVSEIIAHRKLDQTFEPHMDGELKAQKIAAWHKAVERSQDWAME